MKYEKLKEVKIYYFGMEINMDELQDFLKSRKKMNLLKTGMNILVFIIFTVIGSTEDVYFMLDHGACYTPAILQGEYYRLFTGMFLHFGLYHLIYNMICLIFLGDLLETVVGSVKYLMIYLIGGLAGNVLSLVLEMRSGEYAVSAGASGAIFAVIGALLYIIIRNKGRLGDITLRRMAMMAALSILQGFMDTGTDNVAHIGGFFGGFLLAVLLYHKRKEKEPTYTADYF